MDEHLSSIILIGIIACIYFIPSFVARGTKHSSGILVLNTLLGWTILGWIAALIWAVSSPKIYIDTYANNQHEYGMYVYTCEKCGNKESHYKKINPFKCSRCNAEHWY